MAERPILFSGPMVNAILADTKTMTRRIVGWRGDSSGDDPWCRDPRAIVRLDGTWQAEWAVGPEMSASSRCRQPPAVGDVLWVREAWAYQGGDEYLHQREPRAVAYRATHEWKPWETTRDAPGGRWRPSIHMPRWASRLSLRVTSVRVERLQDITPADILAEGFGHEVANRMAEDGEPVVAIDAALLDAWAEGWDGINGKRASWASNPFVWVVGFERVKP